MCALPRPLNPTTATRTVLFGLWSALALRAAGNATELRMKCRLSTSVITNLPSALGASRGRSWCCGQVYVSTGAEGGIFAADWLCGLRVTKPATCAEPHDSSTV